MIDNISIRNFQAHRSLDINPTEILCLVGPSDCGKSAIIRAIIWCLTNRPSGSAYVTHGETETSVTLDIDGRTISRSKSGPSNAYALDGDRFIAFGASVPEPVAEALQVKPINIQQQHDAAFWFSDSPGQVSAALNQIVDLGSIDSALANINRTVSATKSDVESARGDVRHLQDELGKLGDVASKKSQFEVLEILVVAATQSLETAGMIHTAIRDICCKQSNIQKLTVDPIIEDSYDVYARNIAEAQRVRKAIHGIEAQHSEIAAMREHLARLQAEFNALPNVCPTCGQTTGDCND